MAKRFPGWILALVFVCVFVPTGFLAFGIAAHWGAQQWGSYGQCVAAGLTLAAVVVALRESLRGQGEALSAQRSRLIDHELTRRRENLNALADLWAAIIKMNSPIMRFQHFFDDLPERFNPRFSRDDYLAQHATGPPLESEIVGTYEDLVAKWTETVEPPLFTCLALIQGTKFAPPLNELNLLLHDLKSIHLLELGRTSAHGVRPDTKPLSDAWQVITRLRREHLDLAREHFTLDRTAAEKAIEKAPGS